MGDITFKHFSLWLCGLFCQYLHNIFHANEMQHLPASHLEAFCLRILEREDNYHKDNKN